MAMRLSGLASGMDTDSMVKQLMNTERIKLDKLNQSKQILSWKQETFNSLNKDLVNFILDSKKKLGIKTNYSGGISYNNITWSKSATSSKDSKVTATALPSAMDGTHTIDIKRIAEGVTAVSSGNITTGGKKDVVANQFSNLGKDDILEFTIGGKNGDVTFRIGDDGGNTPQTTDGANNIIRINKKLDQVSLSEIVSKINSANVNNVNQNGEIVSSSPLGVQTSYDSNIDRFFIQTRDTGIDATLKIKADTSPKGKAFIDALKLDMEGNKNPLKLKDGITYGGTGVSVISATDTGYGEHGSISSKLDMKTLTKFHIKIGTEDVEILESDSMTDIAAKIDGLDGITAKYENGKLSIQGGTELTISSSGTDEELEVSKNFLNSLGLIASSSDGTGLTQNGDKVYAGINAKINYSIGGTLVKTDMEYSSNNFTINGINFTAKVVEVAEVTIGTNTDDVYNKIKEFIDGYNAIVDKMNTLVSEKRYRSFTPLTSEQKEAMSDEEVKLWESKAKSGILRGDDTVSTTLQTVRSGLYDAVEGVNGSYNHITKIGITTEKFVSGSMGGKLTIDENKLKEAIANDANGVLNLLFKSPTGELDTDDANLTADKLKQKRAESGIITRVYHNLAEGMKGIVDKSGLGEEIDLLREVRARITQDFATKSSGKSILDNYIFDYDKKIDRMNDYLTSREQFYYNKFTAMEKAIQSMSSQSSWLSQQFGGGN